jgi:hypothetical protein
VATASRNCCQLSVKVFRNAADSGISTIRLMYSSAKPSARSKPGSTLWRLSRARRRIIAARDFAAAMTWSYSAPSLKWSFCAAVQPPKTWSTVKVLTFGKALAYLASTAAERGRRW